MLHVHGTAMNNNNMLRYLIICCIIHCQACVGMEMKHLANFFNTSILIGSLILCGNHACNLQHVSLLCYKKLSRTSWKTTQGLYKTLITCEQLYNIILMHIIIFHFRGQLKVLTLRSKNYITLSA